MEISRTGDPASLLSIVPGLAAAQTSRFAADGSQDPEDTIWLAFFISHVTIIMETEPLSPCT